LQTDDRARMFAPRTPRRIACEEQLESTLDTLSNTLDGRMSLPVNAQKGNHFHSFQI